MYMYVQTQSTVCDSASMNNKSHVDNVMESTLLQ